MTQQKSKQKRQITVEQNFTKMSHFTRLRANRAMISKLPKINLTELTQPNFWNEIFGENEIFWLISPLCVQGTYYRAYASDCPKDLIMKSVKLSNWLQVLFFSFPGPGSIPSSSWSTRSSANVLFTTKNPVHFSITIVVQLIWLLKRVKIYFDGQAKNSRGKITHPQKYRKILVNFTVYENPQKYLIFTNFWIYAPKLLCFEVTFRAWKFKYQRYSSLRSPYCKMRLLGDFPTLYVIRIINWKKWAWKNCLLWSSSWQTKAKEEVSGFNCVNNVLWDTQHVHKHHQCKNMTILSIFFSCILDFKLQSSFLSGAIEGRRAEGVMLT